MDKAEQKKKILIIEDDFFIRDLFVSQAQLEGYEVITAVDGEEALVKAHAVVPDFVLLDIMIPKVDGITVLKSLKADQQLAKVPVIVVTNLEDKTKEYEARKEGALDYILKVHSSPAAIISQVKEYLSQ